MVATPFVVQNHQPMRLGQGLQFDRLPLWVDNLFANIAGAQNYVVPSGPPGPPAAPGGTNVPITMIVISSDTNLWVSTNGGVAAIPTASTNTGVGFVLVNATVPRFFSDVAGLTLSIFFTAAGHASIEGWA